MACNVINSWTFTGLVGAFLDLSIAYLLLCGSTLAYLTSKFLGLFALSLPCPCKGLFGYPNKDKCLQAMLVDDPSLKIFYLQSSVKKKFPFDSIMSNFYDGEYEELHDSQSNMKKEQNGMVEIEGEASSSRIYNERHNLVGKKKGSFGPKSNSKGFGSQRARVGLRWRKRATSGHGGKVFSFSNDHLMSITAPTGLNSSSSFGKFGNDIVEESTNSSTSEGGSKILKEIGFPDQGSQQFKVEDDCFAEIKCLAPDQNFNDSDKNTIKILKHALQEEHANRNLLYLELEKERNAAATAADEAMAMILRLQEEKAAVEMEARQYQRMIEEKSAFDAEEMNILKEILLRREKEKHFLEKEVEAYRQMLFEKEQYDTDLYDLEATQGKRTFEYEITPIKSVNHTFAFGEELPIPEVNEDVDPLNSREADDINKKHEFQEKGMASMNTNQESCMASNISTTPQGPELHDKAVIKAMVEVDKQYAKTSPYQQSSVKKTVKETKMVSPYGNEEMEKHVENLHGSHSGVDYPAHDVYAIYDEPNMCNEESRSKNGKMSKSLTSDLPRTSDNPTIEHDCIRSSSDRFGRLPPIYPSQGKSLPPILRRNSMSALDYERSKIDNEVGWLREKLKIVQQGREKLKLPAVCKEKEHVQLQMLENTANQPQEIQQLTGPHKAFRQASIPSTFSKFMSKKRCSRGSPDLGVLRSV